MEKKRVRNLTGSVQGMSVEERLEDSGPERANEVDKAVERSRRKRSGTKKIFSRVGAESVDNVYFKRYSSKKRGNGRVEERGKERTKCRRKGRARTAENVWDVWNKYVWIRGICLENIWLISKLISVWLKCVWLICVRFECICFERMYIVC